MFELTISQILTFTTTTIAVLSSVYIAYKNYYFFSQKPHRFKKIYTLEEIKKSIEYTGDPNLKSMHKEVLYGEIFENLTGIKNLDERVIKVLIDNNDKIKKDFNKKELRIISNFLYFDNSKKSLKITAKTSVIIQEILMFIIKFLLIYSILLSIFWSISKFSENSPSSYFNENIVLLTIGFSLSLLITRVLKVRLINKARNVIENLNKD